MLLRRIVLSMSAIAAIGMTAPTTAEAQGPCTVTTLTSCNFTHDLSVTVPIFARLNLTSPIAALSAPDFSTGADLDAGTKSQTDLARGTIAVAANTNWEVTINAAWQTQPGSKAIGDVEWTDDGGTSWTAFTGSAVTFIGSGTPGGYAAVGHSATLGLRTLWRLADEQGAYTLRITYEMTAS